MFRARLLAVVVVLLSYGAVGARQPAVRSAAPLPVPAAEMAEALGLASTDPGRIVLDVIRLVYDEAGHERGVEQLRLLLQHRLERAATPPGTVPLPLDPSIWRDTLLERDVPDSQIIAAVLSNRRAALFYHGLAALDDETLAWLGPDRNLLSALFERAATFAVFGRSLRVKAGRVVVPGGHDAEEIWEGIVGASPDKPAAFARRLFSQKLGHVAFFYDTVAHLDDGAQKFALGALLPASSRLDRVRALADTFDRFIPDVPFEDRPFSRMPFDPAVTLSVLDVDADGTLVGPADRSLWETVFRNDGSNQPDFEMIATTSSPRSSDSAPADAQWILSRIHRHGAAVGRRRLNTFLFAQRNGHALKGQPGHIVTALKGVTAFPALMFVLERAHVTSPAILAAAAERARSLSDLPDDDVRRAALMQFQGVLGIVERAVRSSAMSVEAAAACVKSLVALELTHRGYEGRVAAWIRSDLLPAIVGAGKDGGNGSAERAVLAAMAGVKEADGDGKTLEWEGRTYYVDPGKAEMQRLERVRQRQKGITLDDALAAFAGGTGARDKVLARASQQLGDTLASLIYAIHLGDPEGRALATGNVALRHDFGEKGPPNRRVFGAWQLPTEEFGGPTGWHMCGSLLGLDLPLGRLTLRRLDTGTMPPPPRLTTTERQLGALTVALMNPNEFTDAARDEIVAAMGRGRARVAALGPDRDQIARLAADAGMSEWRREALAWTIAHDRSRLEEQFSLLELLWLGAPRQSAAVRLDSWGAAMQTLKGCLCLEMPKPRPAEYLRGRPGSAMLAARGTDVVLQVAQTLSELKLPASLTPGIAAFAMLQVMDAAQPSHHDDWEEFSRRARELDKDVISDYIAALAADGPLRLVGSAQGRQR